jgi:hypothetical protein
VGRGVAHEFHGLMASMTMRERLHEAQAWVIAAAMSRWNWCTPSSCCGE